MSTVDYTDIGTVNTSFSLMEQATEGKIYIRAKTSEQLFQKINKQLLNSSAVRWGFFIKVPLISAIKATTLSNTCTPNCHPLESFYFSLSHCHEYVQQFEPQNKVNAFFHAAMHPSVADSALEPSILSLHHAVNWTLKHFKPCTPLAADWTASTKPLHHAIEPQSMVNLLLDMYPVLPHAEAPWFSTGVLYATNWNFHEYCEPVFSTRVPNTEDWNSLHCLSY